MEYFDLYDRNLQKLPKTMARGGHNQPGEYHMVVHIWIRNPENQYLIQQRNKTSDIIPYQWGTTSGAVLAGETSQEAALRETQEEIGIQLDPSKLQLIKRYFIDDEQANYITDLYLYCDNILLSDCKIDTLEVRDIGYKTLPEIRAMIQQKTFWDYEHIIHRMGYFQELERS